MAIHSQILNCSASEVAAMIEGVMRHATAMNVDGNYVDSHGQSEIGFAAEPRTMPHTQSRRVNSCQPSRRSLEVERGAIRSSG